MARRKPTQARALRTRARILEAAAALIEREQLPGLNTNAVAREAGVAIGTLYDYFPNKDAILVALLEAFRERLAERLAVAVGDPSDPVDAIAGRVVDAFYAFYAEETGYAALWLGAQVAGAPLRETSDAWSDSFGAWLEGLIGARAPQLAREDRAPVARTLVYLVSGLLSAALTRPEAERPRLVRETKRAVIAYLHAALASAAP